MKWIEIISYTVVFDLCQCILAGVYSDVSKESRASLLNCRCSEGPSGVKKMRYAVQFVTGRMELVGKIQKPGKVADMGTPSMNVVGEVGFSGE